MQLSEPTFDRSDLILAWLTRRRYRNAHEDLRSYHDAVATAFSKAFGIDLDTLPEREPSSEENGLHGLFLNIVDSYEDVRSPFSNYMCGTREISEMYQKYGEPLKAAGQSLKKLHLMLMVELVERIWGWGGDMPHRVSQQELDACGYPAGTAPDPVDYW